MPSRRDVLALIASCALVPVALAQQLRDTTHLLLDGRTGVAMNHGEKIVWPVRRVART